MHRDVIAIMALCDKAQFLYPVGIHTPLISTKMADQQHIFINYRRSDTAFAATFLYSKLAATFGKDGIFKDIDSFQPGDDFPTKLADCVENSHIFLALIGPEWLAAKDSAGRRIDNPRDWVRIEIASALRLKKLVIPVLIDNAEMPTATDLPEVLQPLADKHAFRVSADRADQELDHLVLKLQGIVDRLAQERAEAKRKAEQEAAQQAAEREARAQREEAQHSKKAMAAAPQRADTARTPERVGKPKAEAVVPAKTSRHSSRKQGFVPKTSWSISGRARYDNTAFLGLLLATIIFGAFIYGISLPFKDTRPAPETTEQAEPANTP